MQLQDKDVTAITSRLETVIRLMAALLARDLKNNQAIVKLERMQLSREQIADALGITTANVAQVLYANKKNGNKGKAAESADKDRVPQAVPEVEA